MAAGKNPKRLLSLKKSRDFGLLLICKDTSSNSFESWPEDSKSSLSLVGKYNKTISVKNGGSGSGSGLGKRKGRRSDTQEDFLGLANEKEKKIDTQMMDFLEMAEKVKVGVKDLRYNELIQILSKIDQAKMGVDQRLQLVKQELCFVLQEFDLFSENDFGGSFDGFDVVSGNVFSDSGPENDQVSDMNAFDTKKSLGLAL